MMNQDKYGAFFAVKTLIRAAFAALVLTAAAAHAQPGNLTTSNQSKGAFATQHQGESSGNRYNWMAGGGGN